MPSPGRGGALAQAIVAARDRSGMSRKEFAAAIGEIAAHVTAYESGDRAVSVARALRWARALQIADATFVEPLLKDMVRAAGADAVTCVRLFLCGPMEVLRSRSGS